MNQFTFTITAEEYDTLINALDWAQNDRWECAKAALDKDDRESNIKSADAIVSLMDKISHQK